MVSVSIEQPEQTERRLRRVLAAAEFVVHPGAWCFEESPLAVPPQLTGRELAVIRDDEVWSTIAPWSGPPGEAETFGVFSFHFPADLDNSGFVGWLATTLKRDLGTGVFVVCGSNSRRGGIFDYWGLPADLLPKRHRSSRLSAPTLRTSEALSGSTTCAASYEAERTKNPHRSRQCLAISGTHQIIAAFFQRARTDPGAGRRN